jgi:hypothetical protein
MSEDEKLKNFLAKRDALFKNPTEEAALKYWKENHLPEPLHPSVPLAAVHKGRLQWLDATDEMLTESKIWLTANGYDITMKGAPPLTPEQRDADRIELGKEPLNKK